MQHNRGLIKEIALIIIALGVLYAMGFSLRGFLDSNIARHIIDIVSAGWGTLWERGLGKILSFAWNNGYDLWIVGWNGILMLIEKLSAFIPG